VFGLGAEEVLALREAGVRTPIHVIPGVSSALAVPGSVGVPVTHKVSRNTFVIYIMLSSKANRQTILTKSIHLNMSTFECPINQQNQPTQSTNSDQPTQSRNSDQPSQSTNHNHSKKSYQATNTNPNQPNNAFIYTGR
jgi:precorrin-2 methylase